MLNIGVISLDENILTTPVMHEFMIESLDRIVRDIVFGKGSLHDTFSNVRLHALFLPNGGDLACIDFVKNAGAKNYVIFSAPSCVTSQNCSNMTSLHSERKWHTLMNLEEPEHLIMCRDKNEMKERLLKDCQIVVGFTTSSVTVRESWIKSHGGHIYILDLDKSINKETIRSPSLDYQLQKSSFTCGQTFLRQD
jgi:hypothetical protein